MKLRVERKIVGQSCWAEPVTEVDLSMSVGTSHYAFTDRLPPTASREAIARCAWKGRKLLREYASHQQSRGNVSGG